MCGWLSIWEGALGMWLRKGCMCVHWTGSYECHGDNNIFVDLVCKRGGRKEGEGCLCMCGWDEHVKHSCAYVLDQCVR